MPFFHKAVDKTEFDLAKDIRIAHVVKENRDFYFIVNEGESRFEGSLKLPVNMGISKEDEAVERIMKRVSVEVQDNASKPLQDLEKQIKSLFSK